MNVFLFLILFIPLSLSGGVSVYTDKEANGLWLTEKGFKNNLVYWQKEHPLQWDFFKGKVDAADEVHGAVTYAGIDLQAEKQHPLNGEITFKAMAVFDKNLSWVKPDCKDARLLAHEQLHFDIAEIFARRLETKLNSLKLSRKDIKTIKKLQQQYSRKQLEVQKRYDEETIHGIRAEQQKEWRKATDRQLNKPGAAIFQADTF